MEVPPILTRPPAGGEEGVARPGMAGGAVSGANTRATAWRGFRASGLSDTARLRLTALEAGNQTLMGQAPSTANEYLMSAVDHIDRASFRFIQF